ncbi:MAG: patatin-like phospholipase family protein [Thermodesulfobacteriota bacterium]
MSIWKSILRFIWIFFLLSCTIKETPPPPVLESSLPPSKPAKISLVLGAGASKGFAHVGVLKILETNRIPIHMIVGTSVGSLVGALYASGISAYDLQKLSFSIEQKDLIDLTFPENGFIKGEKLEEFINKILKNTPMEKLKIPFYAVATEIQSGRETVFGRGNTGQAVRASCSIPGVFRPVKIGEKIYVDGGVVSPVAVEAAKRLGADKVIAVDISATSERTPPRNTIETILQSINIMYSKLSAIQISQADVIIRPNVGFIGSADFSKRHDAILEGEKATLEVLPKIMEILAQLRLERKLE